MNTTQRLEALGKQIDDGAEVTILITAATRAHLGARFTVVSAGAFHVPGKEHPLQVFRLLPDAGRGDDRNRLRISSFVDPRIKVVVRPDDST